MDDCTKALSLQPSSEMALPARSKAYYFDSQALMTSCRADFGMKRYDDARTVCTKVLAYDPQEENAYLYRGRSAFEQKDFQTAIQDLRRLAAMDPEFTGAHYWLAAANYGAADYAGALSEIDAYLLKFPHDADALLLRAQSEAKLGKIDRAKFDAQEAQRQYKIKDDDAGVKTAQSIIDSLKP